MGELDAKMGRKTMHPCKIRIFICPLFGKSKENDGYIALRRAAGRKEKKGAGPEGSAPIIRNSLNEVANCSRRHTIP